MATDKPTVMCPECDVEMNHHADKLVHPTSAAERTQMDADLAGLIEEERCCPGCGKGYSYRVSS